MIELFVLGATLVVAAGASGAQHRRRRIAARALARYATSRRHVFVPAPPAPRGASPRVIGEVRDVRFVIDLHRVEGELCTRVSASARARGPKVRIVQRRKATRPLAVVPCPLARAYRVTAETPDAGEAALALERDLLLLDRRDGVRLASDGERVSLSWLGAETNPVVLDAACDAVTAFAALHRSEAPYR